ncbi:MAG: WbqC family protein [Candidatus Hydrogenedentota bacterium]
MKRLMMLQPGYLPWLGFFEQIYRTDIFVVFDDAQYTKLDWRNRNRIKSTNGKDVYITVPVKKAPTKTLIKDIKISYNEDWQKRHINLLKACYGKTPYFNDYFEPIIDVINKRFEYLIDLDMELIFLCMNFLGLERDISYSSRLKTEVRGKERLMAVCIELGASYCYNGAAGKNLYSVEKFLENGIKLEFQEFKSPVYPQFFGDFIPNLSIVDLLFNCGDKSLNVLTSKPNHIVQTF